MQCSVRIGNEESARRRTDTPVRARETFGVAERVYPTLKSEAILANPYASATEMRESIVVFRPASVRVLNRGEARDLHRPGGKLPSQATR